MVRSIFKGKRFSDFPEILPIDWFILSDSITLEISLGALTKLLESSLMLDLWSIDQSIWSATRLPFFTVFCNRSLCKPAPDLCMQYVSLTLVVSSLNTSAIHLVTIVTMLSRIQARIYSFGGPVLIE